MHEYFAKNTHEFQSEQLFLGPNFGVEPSEHLARTLTTALRLLVQSQSTYHITFYITWPQKLTQSHQKPRESTNIWSDS